MGEWRYRSILDLGTRWRLVVSFTLRSLYPQGESLWYPLDMRLGGPQRRSGLSREEKISYLCRESNPFLAVCSLSLYRLSYPGSKEK
jgi:hypothetical protein